MRNAELHEAQAGIKISGRNINNLTYADYTALTEEIKEELESLLIRVEDGSEKAGLTLNIQRVMASSPITSWQIDGGTMETVTDFMFLGSKTAADCAWSCEIKDAFSLEEKLLCQQRSV